MNVLLNSTVTIKERVEKLGFGRSSIQSSKLRIIGEVSKLGQYMCQQISKSNRAPTVTACSFSVCHVSEIHLSLNHSDWWRKNDITSCGIIWRGNGGQPTIFSGHWSLLLSFIRCLHKKCEFRIQGENSTGGVFLSRTWEFSGSTCLSLTKHCRKRRRI